MAAKPLTTAAIAMTEKKMDMSLDDIIKMSKVGTGTNKAKKQRIPNKNQKFSNNVAQDKPMKLKRFMDSRSSLRQFSLNKCWEHVVGTGHNRGRGQVLRRANSSLIVLAERSSSSVGNTSWAQSSVGERSYTQAEVDSLVASTFSRLETKLNVLLRGLKANNIEIEFEEEESGDEESDGDGDEDEG